MKAWSSFICLESSAPILPPAPVIKIFPFCIFFLRSSFLGNTTSLPKISSTSTNFICSSVTKSFSISSRLGNDLTSSGYLRKFF